MLKGWKYFVKYLGLLKYRTLVLVSTDEIKNVL